MIKKYLKIIALSFKSGFSFYNLVKTLVEYAFYFLVIKFLLNNLKFFSSYSSNQLISMTAIYLLIIFLFKLFYETAQIFRYQVLTGEFDLSLVQPINTIFKLIFTKINLINIIVLLAFIFIALYFNFGNVIPLFSVAITSLGIFILGLAFLLITLGRVSAELFLFLIFILGFMVNGPGIYVFLFSVVLVFVAIKFWNLVLIKYTSANG